MDDELFKLPPTSPYPPLHLLVRDRYNKVCRKEDDEEEEKNRFGRGLW
jgi:hypothetical protein